MSTPITNKPIPCSNGTPAVQRECAKDRAEFLAKAKDGSGAIEKAEVGGDRRSQDEFRLLDRNGDGRSTWEEFQAGRSVQRLVHNLGK